MAATWGSSIKAKANVARAQQVRYFKQVWLANGSPHAIVTNVLTKDLDEKEAPMKVNPELVKTGLKTTAAVIACLKSEEMYLNPTLYNLLCCGVESGKLKGGRKQSPSSLRRLMTIAHEAHLRLELCLALSRQRYNKKPNTILQKERKVQWKKFCVTVYNDRERNADAAEQARLRGVGVHLDHANVGEVADADFKEPLVDKRFY